VALRTRRKALRLWTAPEAEGAPTSVFVGIGFFQAAVGADLDLFPDDARRVSRDDAARRHIFRHNAARRHDAFIAHAYPRQDQAMRPDEAAPPDIGIQIQPPGHIMRQNGRAERDIRLCADMDAFGVGFNIE
jgi:hypothetical protein